jgi:hypothetical protein
VGAMPANPASSVVDPQPPAKHKRKRKREPKA